MNRNLGRIVRDIIVVVFFSASWGPIFGWADVEAALNVYLQADSQGQQTAAPAPDSAKASQDSQKAADEAKAAAAEAKSAAEEAKSAKSSAVSAAGEASSAATNLDKASSESAAAAQKAGSAAGASQAAAETAKKKALQADAAAGVALNGSTNVKENVSAQVVLLPRKQAERVFSKEIGRRYAVVQVTINNQSKDAAFLLQSIYVDYSHWTLSGMSFSPQGCPSTPPNTSPTCPGQVASVESRVIRGELQDASAWTWRNGLIRVAVLVGTVASGIPAFSSKEAVKYVDAYNGQFVPGVQAFWPDGTVPQLNRVSDLGFQTNKVIGKDSADIVYAFFPIDRFLTPGMRNIFLNSPAVFFAPAQIFVDRHIGKHCWKPGVCLSQSDIDEMKNLIEDLASTSCQAQTKSLGQDLQDLCPSATAPKTKEEQHTRDQKMLLLLTMHCATRQTTSDNKGDSKDEIKEDNQSLGSACQIAQPVQELVVGTSLNSINVLVQGTMTVDVTMVPATITDITFDKGNTSAEIWQNIGSPLDGTVTGRFLTGGILSVTSIEVPTGHSDKIVDYIDPKSLSMISDDSSDTRLRFKLQWKTAIPEGSKLHFQVTKYDPKDTKRTSGVKSMDFVLPVSYVLQTQSAGDKPIISDITVDNADVAATWNTGSTLTGKITGNALESALPSITKIAVPTDKNAILEQYIDTATVAVDATKKNDGTTLYVKMSLKKTLPPESVLTFEVTKGTGDKAAKSGTKEYTVTLKKQR